MKRRALRIGLAVLLAVGIGLAWWSRDMWTAEAIVAWVEGLGVWGPLIFVGIYTYCMLRRNSFANKHLWVQ